MASDFGPADDYDREGQAMDRHPPVKAAYARLIERLPAHGGHPPAHREDKADALLIPPAPPRNRVPVKSPGALNLPTFTTASAGTCSSTASPPRRPDRLLRPSPDAARPA